MMYGQCSRTSASGLVDDSAFNFGPQHSVALGKNGTPGAGDIEFLFLSYYIFVRRSCTRSPAFQKRSKAPLTLG
jgi:hypothetical protein